MDCLQLVYGKGEFNATGAQEFFSSTKLEHCGRNYQVVAIMGPQSSGKSTLLNSVFGTHFQEMNALEGRQQTTKGVWLSKSMKVDEPITLVMDLEGNDGRERGEDDVSFERQTALFALAVADVVLINMWAKDIGRETGAGKPLLKTIFQVNLKLFTPAPNKRKTLLLFVFRDRTKTPLEKLIEIWEQDLMSMWNAITKPPQYEALSFTDFFEVRYAALSNFEEKEEDFKAEAVMLRRRFTIDESPTEDTLVHIGDDKIPGNTVMLSIEKVWEVVKANKDLNLPAHRVMVANIRCQEIVREQLAALTNDQAWQALQEQAATSLVPDFGESIGTLVNSCLSGYDEEARYFEQGVCADKRWGLVSSLEELVRPMFDIQVQLLQQNQLDAAKEKLYSLVGTGNIGFAAAAAEVRTLVLEDFSRVLQSLVPTALDWDVPAKEKAMEAALDGFVAAETNKKVSETLASNAKAMTSSLTSPTTSLLDAPPPDLWPRLYRLYNRSLDSTFQKIESALEGYEVPQERLMELKEELDAQAQQKLHMHLREAANTASSRVRDRFNEVFHRNETGMPRRWGPRVDIPSIAAQARVAAAHVLAQLAVVRKEGGDYTAVAKVVTALAESSEGTSAESMADSDVDILALAEWPDIPEDDVLLAPPQCRVLWRQLISDSNLAVQQAVSTQEANVAASNRMPPIWALLAIMILGFNELMTVLYNPLYLLSLGILYFFGKTVYNELDVDAEMSRGLLPGLIALSAKFVPTVKRVTESTIQSCKHFISEASHAEAPLRMPSPTQGSYTHASAHDHSGIELSQSTAGLRKRQPATADSDGVYTNASLAT